MCLQSKSFAYFCTSQYKYLFYQIYEKEILTYRYGCPHFSYDDDGAVYNLPCAAHTSSGQWQGQF